MNIKYENPPNYESIKAALPQEGKEARFYCYGDTIFSPSGAQVPEDIIFHEMVHSKRQGNAPDSWWNNYLLDKDFRLQEELVAYAHQYNFVRRNISPKAATQCLLECGQSLANNYNVGMDTPQAMSKIRNKAKEIWRQ